jgi:hypothetical protein
LCKSLFVHMDYEAYDWFAWSKWLNTVASSTWNNELGEVQGIYSNCHEVMLQGVASVVQWYFGLSENALLVDHKLYGLPQLSKFLFVPMVSSSLVVRNSQLINATWGIHSCKPSSDFKVCPLQHFVIIPRYTAEDVVFGAHGSYPSDVSSKLWQKMIHFYSFNTTVIDRDTGIVFLYYNNYHSQIWLNRGSHIVPSLLWINSLSLVVQFIGRQLSSGLVLYHLANFLSLFIRRTYHILMNHDFIFSGSRSTFLSCYV